MTKSVLFAFVLFCIAAGACAQQVRPREEHVKKQDELQQRRAAVRAALALRAQKGDAAEEPNKPRRQLTAEERQELRRQLRQQRNDSARP